MPTTSGIVAERQSAFAIGTASFRNRRNKFKGKRQLSGRRMNFFASQNKEPPPASGFDKATVPELGERQLSGRRINYFAEQGKISSDGKPAPPLFDPSERTPSELVKSKQQELLSSTKQKPPTALIADMSDRTRSELVKGKQQELLASVRVEPIEVTRSTKRRKEGPKNTTTTKAASSFLNKGFESITNIVSGNKGSSSTTNNKGITANGKGISSPTNNNKPKKVQNPIRPSMSPDSAARRIQEFLYEASAILQVLREERAYFQDEKQDIQRRLKEEKQEIQKWVELEKQQIRIQLMEEHANDPDDLEPYTKSKLIQGGRERVQKQQQVGKELQEAMRKMVQHNNKLAKGDPLLPYKTKCVKHEIERLQADQVQFKHVGQDLGVAIQELKQKVQMETKKFTKLFNQKLELQSCITNITTLTANRLQEEEEEARLVEEVAELGGDLKKKESVDTQPAAQKDKSTSKESSSSQRAGQTTETTTPKAAPSSQKEAPEEKTDKKSSDPQQQPNSSQAKAATNEKKKKTDTSKASFVTNQAARRIAKFLKEATDILTDHREEKEYWEEEQKDIKRRKQEELQDIKKYILLEKKQFEMELKEQQQQPSKKKQEGVGSSQALQSLKEHIHAVKNEKKIKYQLKDQLSQFKRQVKAAEKETPAITQKTADIEVTICNRVANENLLRRNIQKLQASIQAHRKQTAKHNWEALQGQNAKYQTAIEAVIDLIGSSQQGDPKLAAKLQETQNKTLGAWGLDKKKKAPPPNTIPKKNSSDDRKKPLPRDKRSGSDTTPSTCSSASSSEKADSDDGGKAIWESMVHSVNAATNPKVEESKDSAKKKVKERSSTTKAAPKSTTPSPPNPAKSNAEEAPKRAAAPSSPTKADAKAGKRTAKAKEDPKRPAPSSPAKAGKSTVKGKEAAPKGPVPASPAKGKGHGSSPAALSSTTKDRKSPTAKPDRKSIKHGKSSKPEANWESFNKSMGALPTIKTDRKSIKHDKSPKPEANWESFNQSMGALPTIKTGRKSIKDSKSLHSKTEKGPEKEPSFHWESKSSKGTAKTSLETNNHSSEKPSFQWDNEGSRGKASKVTAGVSNGNEPAFRWESATPEQASKVTATTDTRHKRKRDEDPTSRNEITTKSGSSKDVMAKPASFRWDRSEPTSFGWEGGDTAQRIAESEGKPKGVKRDGKERQPSFRWEDSSKKQGMPSRAKSLDSGNPEPPTHWENLNLGKEAMGKIVRPKAAASEGKRKSISRTKSLDSSKVKWEANAKIVRPKADGKKKKKTISRTKSLDSSKIKWEPPKQEVKAKTTTKKPISRSKSLDSSKIAEKLASGSKHSASVDKETKIKKRKSVREN